MGDKLDLHHIIAIMFVYNHDYEQINGMGARWSHIIILWLFPRDIHF